MLRATRILKATFEGRIINEVNEKVLILNITSRCNLSCLHCYISARSGKAPELSVDDVRRIAPELQEIGFGSVIISGGEPLLHKDVFKIAEIFKNAGIKTFLSTNGTLINKKNIGKIKELFDYVGISLDGPRDVHDRFRGASGSFCRAYAGVLLCVDEGVRVGVRTTLAEDTVEKIPYIFDVSEKLGVRRIYLSHLMPSGRGKFLKPGEKAKIRQAVEFAFERTLYYVLSRIDIDVATGNNEADSVLLLKIVSKKFPHLSKLLFENLKAVGGYKGGKNLLNIDSLGRIKPDPFFPISLGNIKKDSLLDVWEKNPLLKTLREGKLPKRCMRCEFNQICKGASRSRAFILTWDILGEDPMCYLT